MKQIGKKGRKTTSTYIHDTPLRTAVFTDWGSQHGGGSQGAERGWNELVARTR